MLFAALALMVTVTDGAPASDGLPHIDYIEPQMAREGVQFTLDVSSYVNWNTSHGNLTYFDYSPLFDIDPINGLIEWVPTNQDGGDHMFVIGIRDVEGRESMINIKITVEDGYPYLPPQLPRLLMATQDVPFRFGFSGYFFEGPIVFTNDPLDLFVIDPRTGTVEFTPQNRHVGEWNVTITAHDGFGLSISRVTTIKVVNRNDIPTLDRLPDEVVREGEPVDITLTAHDPDMVPRLKGNGVRVDPAEFLTYRTTLPHPDSFGRDGKMTWVPNDEDAKQGMVTVYYDVTDHSGHGDAFSVTYHVKEMADPPVIGIIGIIEGQKLTEGMKVQLRGSATDGAGDPMENVTYRWYTGTTLIGQTPEILWKVKGHRNTQVRLLVEDQEGREAEEVVNVTIKNVEYGEPLFPVEMCYAFVLASVIILTAMSLSFWYLSKGLPGDRQPPPYR